LTAANRVYIHVNDGRSATDLSACKACRCLAARRHARALTRLYEAKLRPHGLRATQFSVLAALALAGPTPVTRLAGMLGVERTTLTRIAAVLVQHEWISADQRTSDGRQRLLRLTRRGRRKVEEAFPAWEAAQDDAGPAGMRARRVSPAEGKRAAQTSPQVAV
jgi:DNA-binding MarR family transcriptional regulator